MITVTNYNSGEILLETPTGHSLRLAWEEANRLVMFARMHGVEEFIENLPRLIPDEELVRALRTCFETARTKTDRWNFKEKFARLRTISRGCKPDHPGEIVETVKI